MRKLYSLLILSLFFYPVIAQQASKKCATYESMVDFRRLHPGAQTDDQFELWIQQKIQERKSLGFRGQAAYTVPIIFHIVHDGEAVGTGRNISASKISSQLSQLNKDYANQSGSVYGVAADIEIQFCLAQTAPDGSQLAEPGIERIDRNAKGWNAPPYAGTASNSYVDVTIMPNSIWDPNKYFNVWVLDLSGGLLGKATFPAGSTIPDLVGVGEANDHAGVFIEYGSVGSVLDPGPFGGSLGLGRTLSHESGHFLGLRHIWGDANCGNDFCGDTPVQDAETNGCPAPGTLNNCTPSVPKMFENYMDYTDDGCVNTFTADQKARMQTVMANSPRRAQLATSAVCTPPVANAIAFSLGVISTNENPTVLTCPAYREFTVTVKAAIAASGNATVTLTKSGSATDNVDYTVTPASISFTNGDNAAKTITIRIFDDVVVESSETITLGFNISGTGVVAGTVNQTLTVTIADNDVAQTINNNGTVNLINENFGTSGGILPAGWISGDFLGGASDNVWVVSSNGGAGITGQAAHITSDITTKPLTYVSPGGFGDPNSDVVLRTPVINASGLSNLKLSFTYKCNGEADVDGDYDYGILMYSFNGSTFNVLTDGAGDPFIYQGVTAATSVINLALPAFLNSASFYIGFRWINDDNVDNNPPLLIDDVLVTGTALQIESQVSNTGTENIFAGQEGLILSGNDDQLLAKIKNPSANIGCLTATVTSAGNGQIAITTTAGSYQRTQKVIQITPAIANPGVTYEASLYFSTAELAAWGTNRLLLKILKVKDGVNLAGTISASDAEIITPLSATENVAAGYIEYRANFTGFSQFMLVSPNISLPVNLLAFEAKAASHSILLNWSTAQEINNKGFGIERSADGITYKNIGWINGKINSNDRSDYSYTDNFVQPGITYHYRLRQTDIDAREKLSVIRQARLDKSGIVISISPNPAKGRVALFVSGSKGVADVNLINAQGQVVRSWKKLNAIDAPVSLDVSGLAGGVYVVSIQLQEEKRVEKLVIE